MYNDLQRQNKSNQIKSASMYIITGKVFKVYKGTIFLLEQQLYHITEMERERRGTEQETEEKLVIQLTSPNTANAFSRSSLLTQGVKFFTFTAAL
jgi:Fe-S cluster assembly ATPase SufC